VREEKQGLCYARNRGIAESQGDVVAYIDDDILTSPDWLDGMLSIFRETSCDAAGGCIHLDVDGRPLPRWLGQRIWGYLGYIDHGEKRVELDGRRHYPHGGNMAFRREVFDRHGLFNVAIGRVGNKLFKGSEVEFFHRISGAHAIILYEPKARVCHLIKPKELEKRYFRILQLREGEQRAKCETVVYRRTLFGIPLFVVFEFWKLMRGYAESLFSEPVIRFRREMDFWDLAGYVWGSFKRYQGKRKVTAA
jgi:glycosyltransferase involved in cell wall biosynthesis